MIQGCLKKVSSVVQENFKFQEYFNKAFFLQFCCCTDLIAATRAEGGLVVVVVILVVVVALLIVTDSITFKLLTLEMNVSVLFHFSSLQVLCCELLEGVLLCLY